MNRPLFATGLAAAFTLTLAACPAEEAPPPEQENGEPAQNAQAAGTLSAPGWMQVDHEAQTVRMEVVAGSDQTNNRWNFNGYANGNATVVVPEGYEVTIEFRNQDPANPHSLGIDSRTGPDWPATFQAPQPAFDGAITEGAASMTESTQPGESEEVSFTAERAGDYAMVCYVPAHAATGMWILFEVSADGEAGLRTG